MKQHWQAMLKPYLMNPKTRIAIIGIGNSLLGDDGIGLLLAQNLQISLSHERFCILEGALAPENCLGKLRPFQPQLVILLDIVLGLGEVGSIHYLSCEKIEGFSASSHSLPLSILAKFLEAEYACEVFVLAITADKLEETTTLSDGVERAAAEIFA